jgi:hypothetical protein
MSIMGGCMQVGSVQKGLTNKVFEVLAAILVTQRVLVHFEQADRLGVSITSVAFAWKQQ